MAEPGAGPQAPEFVLRAALAVHMLHRLRLCVADPLKLSGLEREQSRSHLRLIPRPPKQSTTDGRLKRQDLFPHSPGG